jgi:hypothetical protein
LLYLLQSPPFTIRLDFTGFVDTISSSLPVKTTLPRYLIAAFAAVCFTAAAFAADPSGTWTWSMQGRSGQTRTVTATFALKDGNLTGSVSSRRGDTAIGNASCRDGAISFTVEREFNGNKIVTQYSGKLDGDTIKGTIEIPGSDGGEARKVDWSATRSK